MLFLKFCIGFLVGFFKVGLVFGVGFFNYAVSVLGFSPSSCILLLEIIGQLLLGALGPAVFRGKFSQIPRS